MSTEEPTEPRAAFGSSPDLGSLAAVARAVDALVVFGRAGLRRAIGAVAVCAGLLTISTLLTFILLSRQAEQAVRFESLAQRVESLATEQTRTKEKVEETKEKVEVAAQAAEDKPTVEFRPAPSSSGKAQAVIVIKPARPKPTASGAAPVSSGPEPGTLELPVKLPETAHIKAADAGPEKK